MTIVKLLATVLAILVAAVLVGCSGSPSSLPMPAAISISVSSPVNSVQAGGTVQVSATVSNTSNSSVWWQVNGVTGGNSSVGTISTSGLYTAPNTPPNPPTVTITGAAAANSSALQAVMLTITPPVMVTISPRPTVVPVNSQQQFTANVSNATDTSVTWEVNSMQGGSSSVGTISNTGLYTAPVSVSSPLTVTVTAVSNAAPAISDSVIFTISPVIVAVMPNNINLQVGTGSSGQFTATVMNAANNNQAVVWQVNGITGGDATVGTISGSGLYAAPNALPANPIVMITAISVADPSMSGNATVTLSVAPPPVTVTISPKSASVSVGTTLAFSATVMHATDTTVTWEVNGTQGGNSTVGTISSTGLYTAPATVPSPATVTVTAVSNADPTKSDSATVTIQPAIVVSVSPAAVNIFVGQSQTFTAQVSNTSNQSVTWSISGSSCSGASCGVIDQAGNYTAPSTVPSPSPNVTITATSVADPSKFGTATAIITIVPTPTVQISPPGPLHLPLNGVQVFNATVSYDPLNQGVTWSLACVADEEGSPFEECTNDSDGDGDKNTLSNIMPNSVQLNIGATLGVPPASFLTLTLTATSVATGTNGGHGSATVTITIP